MNSGYASIPHSTKSTPLYSSSSVTRRPIIILNSPQTMKLVTNTHTNRVTAPMICAKKLASELVNGTANSPQIPTTPCTEIAPTGSSIFTLSIKTIENTTRAPPTAPIMVATNGVGVSGPAVIATRPATAPFRIIVKSAFPNNNLETASAASTPPAAAAFVFIKTTATRFASETVAVANTEPPLNPNQPNHRMKVPRVAKGRLAPGIGRTSPLGPYLPLRAPSRITPANAAAAPAM